jgi:hypothetical protein
MVTAFFPHASDLPFSRRRGAYPSVLSPNDGVKGKKSFGWGTGFLIVDE